MEIPENSIDEFLDAGLKSQETFNQLAEQSNILIHKVFVQNQDGAELLAKWKDQLLLIPTAEPHSTQIEVGINEGMKQFVRNIMKQCESVENTE